MPNEDIGTITVVPVDPNSKYVITSDIALTETQVATIRARWQDFMASAETSLLVIGNNSLHLVRVDGKET